MKAADSIATESMLLWNASMSEAMQPDRFRYPITKREREGAAIRAAAGISMS